MTAVAPSAEKPCPRHGGQWGDDDTCQLCVDGNGVARNRSDLVRVQIEVWYDRDSGEDVGSAVDGILAEIAEFDGVVFVSPQFWTEGL